MSIFIPGNTMTENVRELAWSALPNAPVQPDDRPGFLARLWHRLKNRRPTASDGPAPDRARTRRPWPLSETAR